MVGNALFLMATATTSLLYPAAEVFGAFREVCTEAPMLPAAKNDLEAKGWSLVEPGTANHTHEIAGEVADWVRDVHGEKPDWKFDAVVYQKQVAGEDLVLLLANTTDSSRSESEVRCILYDLDEDRPEIGDLVLQVGREFTHMQLWKGQSRSFIWEPGLSIKQSQFIVDYARNERWDPSNPAGLVLNAVFQIKN